MFSHFGIELDLLPHLTPTTNFQTFPLQPHPTTNQPTNAWEQNGSQSIQEILTKLKAISSGWGKLTRTSLHAIAIQSLVDFCLTFAAYFTTGNLSSGQNWDLTSAVVVAIQIKIQRKIKIKEKCWYKCCFGGCTFFNIVAFHFVSITNNSEFSE